jgi:hypothetical protein
VGQGSTLPQVKRLARSRFYDLRLSAALPHVHRGRMIIGPTSAAFDRWIYKVMGELAKIEFAIS